jgi:GT2 family glycosyltransferase
VRSPSVDLVIVSYQSRRFLERCLRSIEFNTKYPHKIYIVDNASKDGTRRLKNYFPQVNWLWNPTNIGYGRACNQGAAAGSGRYIIFLNCDTEVTPGWLLPLIHCLDSDQRIAWVGPKLLTPDGRIAGAGVVGTNAKPIIRGWMVPDEQGRFDRPIDCISLCGACIGTKRSLITKLGLFDPSFFHYFEETDLCYRARYHGYRVIYEPKSRVIHHISASCQDQKILREHYQKSKAVFEHKWKEFLIDEKCYPENPSGSDDCWQRDIQASRNISDSP